jgi:hypothetical protein
MQEVVTASASSVHADVGSSEATPLKLVEESLPEKSLQHLLPK